MKNASKSVVALGLLFAVLGAIFLLYSLFASNSGTTLIMQITFLIDLVLGVALFFQGRKVKNSTDASSAQSALTASLIIIAVIFAWSVISGRLDGSGVGILGMLSAVAVLYLIVAKSGIKKLS